MTVPRVPRPGERPRVRSAAGTTAGPADLARRQPALTLGLPVYNGARFLAASLDSLLAQTFQDFELVVSDNGSTDGTPEVVRAYAARDPRIRYVRHERNAGSIRNHNFVLEQARGRYFKWVSDDDVYGPELLDRCVGVLRSRPDVVAAHAWVRYIDQDGRVTREVPYTLATEAERPSDRFRCLLHGQGGDDVYGVIRTDVLRRMPRFGSFYHAERPFVAELALHGRFVNIPEYLYDRRDHPERVTRAASVRERAARWDPRRSNRFLHPTARLVAEYLWAYCTAILRAPIGAAERLRCARFLAAWVLGHLGRRRARAAARPATVGS